MGQVYQHLQGTSSQIFQIGKGAGNKRILANNASINKPEIRYNDTTDKWQFSNDGVAFQDFGVGSSEYLAKTITQNSHGFDNDLVYHNGTLWQKARADSLDTTATHLAKSIDTNNFYIIPIGEVDITGLTDENNSALVAGEYYFLSQTVAGKLSSGLSSGIVQSVLKVNTQTHGSVFIGEPYVATTGSVLTFSASNNISTPTDVTSFNFANNTVRAFEALVSVEIDADTDLYEVFSLRGIQKSSSWSLSVTRNGDDSLFNFSITNSGQIQYTNSNYTGFVSATIRFSSNILTK